MGSTARSRGKPRWLGDRLLTPINPINRDIQRKVGKIISVTRQQFPLVPAEAISIHKSQGQTYDQVVVDVTNRLTLPLIYTAFSRAKSLNGLYLVGKELPKIREQTATDSNVIEMARLEAESLLVFNMKSFYENHWHSQIRVLCHNLPNLAKHVDDIKSDPNCVMSNILIFVETRSNNVRITGFSIVGQLDYTGSRPFGILLYRNDTFAGVTYHLGYDVIIAKGAHLEYLAVKLNEIILLGIYISP